MKSLGIPTYTCLLNPNPFLALELGIGGSSYTALCAFGSDCLLFQEEALCGVGCIQQVQTQCLFEALIL